MEHKRLISNMGPTPDPMTPADERAAVEAIVEGAKKRGIVQKPWPVRKSTKKTA